MKSLHGKLLAHLNSQPGWLTQPVYAHGLRPAPLAVAISFETGSGAVSVVQHLARYLESRAPAQGEPWRVFDKNLISQVLEDHHWPVRLAKFLPEDTHNPVDDLMDELLGLHPPASLVVQQSIETVHRLSREGHVILAGWGVNAITAGLPNVFQVRLVGSLEKRVARIEEREGLSRKEARAFIQRSDRGRARYLRKYFHRQVSDVLLYDLVLNTDRFSEIEVAHLIGDTALTRHDGVALTPTVPVIERIL